MFLCSYNSGEGFHIKSSIGVLNVTYLAFLEVFFKYRVY